jgi:hypothetical protein
VASLGALIIEYGTKIVKLPYKEEKRKVGKSKQNFWTLVGTAVLRFTNASTTVPRFAIVFGFFVSLICLIFGILYLILKLLFWDMFSAGTAPTMIGMFFIGAIQIFFIGLVGEYIIKANIRLMNRPLVIEEKRLNFSGKKET